MIEWFERLADVPGVSYAGSAEVDRRRLPGHNLKPRLQVFEFDGRRHESLEWERGDMSTSASPAHERAFQDLREQATEAILRNLNEALELPGELKDYHFGIQTTAGALWIEMVRTASHS